MTDTIPERRPTEEHEPALTPGQVLWCWAQKWGKVAVLVVVGGAAWGVIRGCVVTGADAIGLQTIEAATAQQELNDETHQELQTAVGEIKIQSQTTVNNTELIKKALPARWMNRARAQ